MIIEQLTLGHWRGYRDPHCFRFGPGLNLLLGNNEAGKSTLFEALACLLFDSHTGRRRELAALQPVGTSLAPAAELVFSTGGRRYKVAKQFLEHPQSRLWVARDGGWELEHEGDQADERLRAVLGGQRSTRVLRPEHRGLAQALWYLQRDEPLPAETWDEAVRQGLSGLVATVSESPAERRLAEALERSFAEYYTPTGRIRTGSELATAGAEITTLEQELQQLRDQAAAVDQLRTELEDLAARHRDKAAELERHRAQLPQLAAQAEAAAQGEQEFAALDQRLEGLRGEAAKSSGVLDRVRHRSAQIQEKAEKRADAQRETEDLEEQRGRKKSEEERHRRQWKEELEPELQQVEGQIARLTALERLLTQQREETNLEQEERRQAHLTREIEAQGKALAELLAPSDREWGEFTKLQRELDDAQAQRRVAAIRVSFEPDDPQAMVRSEPETERVPGVDHPEFLVSRPTTFRLPGFGRVAVRGGGESLAELDEKVRRLTDAAREFLDRFAARDVQELSDRRQERLERERQQSERSRELREAQEREPQVTRRLAEIRAQCAATQQRLADGPPEQLAWDLPRVQQEQADWQRRKDRLIRDIAQAQEWEQAARAAAEQLEQHRQRGQATIIELRSQIRSAAGENAADLAPYGDLDQLERQAQAARDALAQAEQEHAARRAAYREAVEAPRLLHRQAVEAVRSLEQDVSELERQRVDRQARLETGLTEGFYTRLPEVEQRLEQRRQRRLDLQRRAEGARVLRELVEAHRQERSAALTAPVGELLNPWIATLTGGSYDRAELSGELLPQALHSPRYDAQLPVDSLSWGTHEQLVVLLRLSLGWLLSGDEPQLVVLDDPLVNADPLRMQRLNLILQEAAQRLQILLATCDDTPYAGQKASLIRVPEDGRIAAEG